MPSSWSVFLALIVGLLLENGCALSIGQGAVGWRSVGVADSAPIPGEIYMNLTLFSNAAERNATCNDGTPSGYYLWRSPTKSNKWIIYLEGGGLCYDLASCLSRPKMLTSSTPWPKRLGAYGLFSTSNNQFSDFNKVCCCQRRPLLLLVCTMVCPLAASVVSTHCGVLLTILCRS